MSRCGSVRRRTKKFRDKAFENSKIVECHYCCHPLTFELAQADHVVPCASGGNSSFENLVICCQPCNNQKGPLPKFPDIILGRNYAKSLVALGYEIELVKHNRNSNVSLESKTGIYVVKKGK